MALKLTTLDLHILHLARELQRSGNTRFRMQAFAEALQKPPDRLSAADKGIIRLTFKRLIRSRLVATGPSLNGGFRITTKGLAYLAHDFKGEGDE